MRKLDSLRAALASVLPAAALEPERLQMTIEKGRVVATGRRPGLAFEWRYTAVLVFLDFSGDPDAVFAAMLAWAGVEQRELLEAYAGGAKGGVEFEIDVLDPHKVDMEIRIPLTEAVTATWSNDNLAWTFEHHQEPPDAERAIAAAAGIDDWPADPAPFAGVQVRGQPLP